MGHAIKLIPSLAPGRPPAFWTPEEKLSSSLRRRWPAPCAVLAGHANKQSEEWRGFAKNVQIAEVEEVLLVLEGYPKKAHRKRLDREDPGGSFLALSVPLLAPPPAGDIAPFGVGTVQTTLSCGSGGSPVPVSSLSRGLCALGCGQGRLRQQWSATQGAMSPLIRVRCRLDAGPAGTSRRCGARRAVTRLSWRSGYRKLFAWSGSCLRAGSKILMLIGARVPHLGGRCRAGSS